MVKMPHWPIPLGNKPIDLDLSRIKLLLEELGNPHHNLPPVIHVAGTNGKGSTIAFLKAIFQAANYKVHTYTSPHLVRFNERINILGTEISDELLYEFSEECRLAAERINLQLTFFEGTTAAAFLAFSKIPADILLLETGLGGRLDATNVVAQPIMSIITSISMDHVEYLGDNLVKIAYEKAGIIKPNCPCVISQQYPDALEMLHQMVSYNQSQCFAYEYDWISYPDDNKNLIYQSPKKNLTLPAPGLQGAHQYINAGNAITAILNLQQFNISDEQIANGVASAIWPARLQKLIEGNIVNKIPSNWQIWVDGAHNEAGSHVLSLWLEDQEYLPTYMIFGMTKGRDCELFLQPFIGKIKQLIGVPIEAEPASYNGEFVTNAANKVGIPALTADSIEEAVSEITKMESAPARIIVCGSLYLAGDILFQNQRFCRK